MVISAETNTTAAPPARSPVTTEGQPPHRGFPFPILKKWGNQRVLRCLNVNRKGEAIGSPPRTPQEAARSDGCGGDGPLEQVREKLLAQLREAEDSVKVPEVVVASSPPWNLRTRRTPTKDPSALPPPPPATGSREERATQVRTVRLRSENVEKRERPRFSIALTREEIDEDFYALTGSRAPRRPKKRPRSVQKQLDMLLPGAWLSEITVDSYKVAE